LFAKGSGTPRSGSSCSARQGLCRTDSLTKMPWLIMKGVSLRSVAELFGHAGFGWSCGTPTCESIDFCPSICAGACWRLPLFGAERARKGQHPASRFLTLPRAPCLRICLVTAISSRRPSQFRPMVVQVAADVAQAELVPSGCCRQRQAMELRGLPDEMRPTPPPWMATRPRHRPLHDGHGGSANGA